VNPVDLVVVGLYFVNGHSLSLFSKELLAFKLLGGGEIVHSP
jgi:hypothetical protein